MLGNFPEFEWVFPRASPKKSEKLSRLGSNFEQFSPKKIDTIANVQEGIFVTHLISKISRISWEGPRKFLRPHPLVSPMEGDVSSFEH